MSSNKLEHLHTKKRRLQDAIYCLQESGVRPDIQDELIGELPAIEADIIQEENEIETKRASYPVYASKMRHQAEKVIERSGTCNICGSVADLTIDHIIPLSKGGTNDPTNLQILCRSCNSSKRDR